MNSENAEINQDGILEIPSRNGRCSVLLRVRYLQVLLILLCSCVLYMMRGSMSVAVLAMTTPTNNTNVEVYNWDNNVKGMVLSSFFWGYTLLQIPAGILAKKYGGHPMLLASLIISGLLCLTLPTFAKYGGWMAVCAVRSVMGLAQACLLPSYHTLLGKWSPPDERTRMSAVAYTGIPISPILAMPLCGILSNTALGWKMIFYCMGGLLLLVALIWAVLSASSPTQHRFISHREKTYIQKSLRTYEKDFDMPIPWGQILTSPATYALMSAHVGYNWCFMMFLIETPAYLKAELQIDVASSSFLSALPFTAKWILSIVFGFACEYTYNRKYLSVTASRKLFNSIGTFGVAAGLIALSFLNSRQGLAAIALIAASAGLQSAVAIGYLMNHIDVSPNFGGLIFSVNNFVANLISIAEPVFTAAVLGDESNVSGWRTVFFTSAGLSVFSNLIYVVWGTAERQPWDCPHPVCESINFDVFRKEDTEDEANTQRLRRPSKHLDDF